jgi:multidrug resistance efflux pump
MKAPFVALAAFALLVAITSETARAQSRAGGDLASMVTASGVIEPQALFDVASTVEGRIQTLGPGSDFAAAVKTGDVLAEIDPTRWQAEAAIAQAELQRAEAGLRVAEPAVTCRLAPEMGLKTD